MKFISSLFLILIISPIVVISQIVSPVSELPDEINETSGLIFLENKIITHNDSGDGPMLYEIDSINGQISRKVVIENAINTDWEDICYDDEYIYIGDFGNNYGNRTDLKVYKISRSDYFNNDTVTAAVIKFSYKEQIDFSEQLLRTNFDAESILSIDDSLYIFSKNYGNFKSYIYSLSKSPGEYHIGIKDSIGPIGLITGAEYNKYSNTILLTGMSLNPLVIELKNYHSGKFSNGEIISHTLELNESKQIEGICSLGGNEYLIASEKTTSNAFLYKLTMSSLAVFAVPNERIKTYPNPCKTKVTIESNFTELFDIYSSSGKLIQKEKTSPINTSNFTSGIYMIRKSNSKNNKSHKIVVE
jgi:hypothetical protein